MFEIFLPGLRVLDLRGLLDRVRGLLYDDFFDFSPLLGELDLGGLLDLALDLIGDLGDLHHLDLLLLKGLRVGVLFLSGLRVLDLGGRLDLALDLIGDLDLLLLEGLLFLSGLRVLDLGGLLDLALLGDLDLAEDSDDGEQEGEARTVLSDFQLLRDLLVAILAVWALKRSETTGSSRKDFSTGG